MTFREEAGPILNGLPSSLTDIDPEETSEWLASLDQVVDEAGRQRARYLMLRLLERARESQIGVPSLTATDYVNSIDQEQEPWFPGDEEVERTYRRWIRWNAAVMVHRAQRPGVGVGGHISTYASAATLYEVGMNHFWRGQDHPGGGDQIFFQGHASPGMYARSFLEGHLTETDLDGFRQEKSHIVDGTIRALSSYPHPRMMPDYWQFPTVSMGIGPMNSIYQAQFNKYLLARGIKDTSDQRVWAFLGDGEMDEPESRGLLQLAANEELDNLTFVINCNLQRLDGPVRGNGKIIQELEAFFRGAGWNVVKVIWGRGWDPLLAKDRDHALRHIMNTTTDGDYQTFRANDGAYVRKEFFGRDPRTLKMVEGLTDEQIWHDLQRGGHDYRKVFAGYQAAVNHTGQPTVILAHTIKGYGLGKGFAGRNATHQMKKMTVDDLKNFRDALRLPITDAQIDDNPYQPPYFHPGEDDPALQYMLERRRALGGSIPERRQQVHPAVAARRRRLRPGQEGLRQADDCHDHGFRAPAQGPHARQGVRQARRADHPRRGAHLRYGQLLPHAEDLQPTRAELHAGGPRPDAQLPRVQAGTDPPPRHQRGRVRGRFHGSSNELLDSRRADDPDLHLLLDVRVPANG